MNLDFSTFRSTSNIKLLKGRVQEFPGTRSRVPWNVVATCLYSVRPGGARAAKYALAAAIGAVDARFTARGPAPPAIVCAVAAAGVDLQSASATTVLKLLRTVTLQNFKLR